jgi:hypothetical protein
VPQPRIDELTVLWAPEASAASPSVRSDDGTLPLVRVGNTHVHAGVATLPWGATMRWHYELGDDYLSTLYPPGGARLEVYTTHLDSVVQDGAPTGTLTAHRAWRSATFPGTTRDWWVYVPAQCRPDEPACVVVFQDGADYRGYVPTVFDNI